MMLDAKTNIAPETRVCKMSLLLGNASWQVVGFQMFSPLKSGDFPAKHVSLRPGS